jgi:prevent-host-death family protein
MKVANTVELKNQTNRLLHRAMGGEPVIVTFRGKPAAALLPLREEDLEDFLIEHSPKLRKLIQEAEEDVAAGRVTPVPRPRRGGRHA